MTYRDSFRTESYRGEPLDVQYRADISRPAVDAQEGLPEDLPIEVEAVYEQSGTALVPFGHEPEEYIEKPRFYEEAEKHCRAQF